MAVGLNSFSDTMSKHYEGTKIRFKEFRLLDLDEYMKEKKGKLDEAHKTVLNKVLCKLLLLGDIKYKKENEFNYICSVSSNVKDFVEGQKDKGCFAKVIKMFEIKNRFKGSDRSEEKKAFAELDDAYSGATKGLGILSETKPILQGLYNKLKISIGKQVCKKLSDAYRFDKLDVLSGNFFNIVIKTAEAQEKAEKEPTKKRYVKNKFILTMLKKRKPEENLIISAKYKQDLEKYKSMLSTMLREFTTVKSDFENDDRYKNVDKTEILADKKSGVLLKNAIDELGKLIKDTNELITNAKTIKIGTS